MATHELHDLRVLGHLERLARDRSANLSDELRVALAGTGDDLAQLLLRQRRGLTRDRPPFGLKATTRRVTRELLPALDQRRVDASASEIRVPRIGAQIAVELLDADEDASHLRDRVDAEVRTRAVRRAPRHLDLEMDEAAMRDGDLRSVGSVTIAASA